MHVHFLQDESFTVIRGRLGYQRQGEVPAFAEAGGTVLFRAGEPHRFWNAGQEDLECAASITPAGSAEFFLAALFASQLANGGRRPGIFDVAFLCHRYRTEYRLSEIPWFVQRCLFPLLVGIGGVLGRYRKYASAPDPLGS